MKRFFFGLFACLALALPAFGDEVIDPDTLGLGLMTREAAPPPATRDSSTSSSFCRDGMETEPGDDDLAPQPTAMKDHCSAPEPPLAT